MLIEMWGDIICPICGMTQLRLRNAVKQCAPGDDVEIVHRSFQIHPGLPDAGVTQIALSHQAGISDAEITRILRPVELAADAEGFGGYHAIDRTLGPTNLTHELLAFASDNGMHDVAWAGMFDAHFRTNRQLWTIDQLVEFAGEIGLDKEEARKALNSGRYAKRVKDEQRRAEDMGARGTPFIVIDGTFTINGAVDTAEFVRIIRRVWDETHPARPMQSLGHGEQCDPEGAACAL